MVPTAPDAALVAVPAGLTIVGDISAKEDITIDGALEGQITAEDHHVTIGASASIKARVVARLVTVAGSVEGSILASEGVRVLAGGSVRGHVTSPSLMLADGAALNGTVDPERTEAAMHVARYRQRQPQIQTDAH